MRQTCPRVVFVCDFSNQRVRKYLKLKSWSLRNQIMRLFNHPLFKQSDHGVWVSDFIEQFEQHPEFEYHILSIHAGMKQMIQEFRINDIFYHFVRSDSNLFFETLNAKLKLQERQDYRSRRKILLKIIDSISPDLVVLCGAENPPYSCVALDLYKYPVYVLLQTVLNNPKMINYTNEARGYRAEMEKKIFQKVHFFGTNGKKYSSYYKAINPDAECLTIKFPSHQPTLLRDVKKDYDFVFYGRLVKNKGIEDVIKAMSKVVKKYPKATLHVIGYAVPAYEKYLKDLSIEGNCENNITFVPPYDLFHELFADVQKGRFVVVPGITGFNSTVRESMLMGLPTIVYNNTAIEEINRTEIRLLAARSEDIGDLSKKMIYAIEHPSELLTMAAKGREYALKVFSNQVIGDMMSSNFQAIINYHTKGMPIPSELLLADN